MSAALRGLAIALIKIANDIRWMASGPAAGLGELVLPALQAGSSIMPGKVNPVMCEMVCQVGAQVIGNDAAIAFAGSQGSFELNTYQPMMAADLIESIKLLGRACTVFAERCIDAVEADAEHALRVVESTPSVAAALNARLGYDRVAAFVKQAVAERRSLRDVILAVRGARRRRGGRAARRRPDRPRQPLRCSCRDATVADMEAVRSIYNSLFDTTTIAWTEEEQTAEQRLAWFSRQTERGFPVLVADDGGAVVGFAAYGDFRGAGKWLGYRYTVEHTIHVRESHWGAGVGRLLLRALIERARPRGCTRWSARSTARTTPRCASTSGSASSRSGGCPRSAVKFGRWLDLVLMQLIVTPMSPPPDGRPTDDERSDDDD